MRTVDLLRFTDQWLQEQYLLRADEAMYVPLPVPRSFARKFPITAMRLENFDEKFPEKRKSVVKSDENLLTSEMEVR